MRGWKAVTITLFAASEPTQPPLRGGAKVQRNGMTMTASTDVREEHQYQNPVRPEILPMSDNPYEDFRYFYRDGMPLRPAPKRRVKRPGWSKLRHNLFDRWHTVADALSLIHI